MAQGEQQMTRECCICGCKYHPRQKNQVTCGDPDCRRIQHLEYMSKYNKAHRKEHREYNRAWMKKRREEQKAEEKARLMSINSFRGEEYAERQMQKTLALAGKIEL